jgi:hypothetical protein
MGETNSFETRAQCFNGIPMSIPVYTYYQPVPGLWPDSDMQELLRLWKQNWSRAGWNPIILQEHHARENPRFDFFNEHFRAKPTRFGEEYTTACAMRWAAVSHFGGGMMVDMDVFNYGWEPREVTSGIMQIFANFPPSGIFMGAVLGSAAHYNDFAELYAAWTPDHYDWNTQAGQYHLDDLRLVERMFDGTKEKPEWLVRSPGCALFPNPGWKIAPLCHFAYSMRTAGFWPKWKFIPELRPF